MIIHTISFQGFCEIFSFIVMWVMSYLCITLFFNFYSKNGGNRKDGNKNNIAGSWGGEIILELGLDNRTVTSFSES